MFEHSNNVVDGSKLKLPGGGGATAAPKNPGATKARKGGAAINRLRQKVAITIKSGKRSIFQLHRLPPLQITSDEAPLSGFAQSL
jgi:hypothetical protein